MPSKNSSKCSVSICRNILKKKIMTEKYIDHLSNELNQLSSVLKRTIDFRESDSALVIGPHGCGKSALMQEALSQLNESCDTKDYLVINLNGLIHIDDNLALKDIIKQMNFESDENEKLTGSFSENLQYLLQSFKDCTGKISKALIFILEEFHLFCAHRNQTLLYNLFDSSQMSQGICVIGITTRLDVTEMLEKRVKSRFSHRQLLLLYQPTIEQRIGLFKNLLQLSSKNKNQKIDPVYINQWNNNINKIAKTDHVVQILKRQLVIDSNETRFRAFLMFLVSQLSDVTSELTVDSIVSAQQKFYQDDKVVLLQGLSVLEICLIISMSHQNEIFDGEPFNFEMIVGRYLKFASQNSAIQITQRPVVLKAFERIKNLELISPVSNIGKNVQKEFQLYNFLLTKEQVTSAVNSYVGIPTDVSQWASSCIL